MKVKPCQTRLHAWQGPGCLKRITMTFPQVVLDGDPVVARGTVNSLEDELAHCEVWLEHSDGRRLLEGHATVHMNQD